MRQKNILAALIAAACILLWFMKKKQPPSVLYQPEKIAKILFFGDEITLHLAATDTQGSGVLMKRRSNDLSVAFSGLAGANSVTSLGRLQDELAKSTPDLVILTLGLWDQVQGLSLQKTLESLAKIFDFLHDKGVMVAYVGLELPQTGDNWLMSVSQLCSEKKVLYISFDNSLELHWKPSTGDEQALPPFTVSDNALEQLSRRVSDALAPWS